ncbi:MAG: hypothetical protein ACYC2G_11240 [Gemmatimonadaceae bacterium]
MNYQSDRTLQETTTSLAPAEVLAAAKRFFSRNASIYSAFIEKESDTHVAMRGQGNEEVIIGVRPAAGGTAVTGSTYLFDQQVARFFASLPPAPPAPPEQPEQPEQPALPVGEETAAIEQGPTGGVTA